MNELGGWGLFWSLNGSSPRHRTIPRIYDAKLMAPLSLVNAPNKVPEHQRVYQAAYRAHTRIWKIVSDRRI